MTFLQTLEPIVRDIVAPAAEATDREARFPRAALDALGADGSGADAMNNDEMPVFATLLASCFIGTALCDAATPKE